jgi:hypothetical protein
VVELAESRLPVISIVPSDAATSFVTLSVPSLTAALALPLNVTVTVVNDSIRMIDNPTARTVLCDGVWLIVCVLSV